MSDLATETLAYQAQLEAVRRMRNLPDVDPEAFNDAIEDLGRAEQAMTVAWLETLTR